MSKRPKLHHEDDDDLSPETKLQHDIDLSDASSSPLLLTPPSPSSTPSPPSSSPTPSPPSSSPTPSAETTQKVYLSWCKNSSKEYERVPQLVERLRHLLWLRRIKVFDRDFVAHFPREEVTSSIVLIFGTINYFADLGCMEELKLIWDSKPFEIIPLFYKSDEMHPFARKYGLGPLYDRPLSLPLNEHWDPPPLKYFVPVGNGKYREIEVNVPLDEHGRRPQEKVKAAVDEAFAKALAEDNNKEGDAEAVVEGEEGDTSENEDIVEAEGEDTNEDVNIVEAEGNENKEGEGVVEGEEGGTSEDEDIVEAEGEDTNEDEDIVEAEGEDTREDEDVVEAEGKENKEGEGVVEGEEGGTSEDEDVVEAEEEDTSEDKDDKRVVYEDIEEPLTIGSFCNSMAHNIYWMSVPLDASLETEYDEINIYALKVWAASNPSGLDYSYKVGLESHLDAVLSFFYPIQEAAKMLTCILIEGPAGSGKTTTAKFLFNTITARLKHFDHSKFIRHPSSYSEDKLVEAIFGLIPRSLIRNEFDESPLLVFYDNINNVEDAQHLAPLLNLVPKNGSTVVIATRYPDLLLPVLPSNTKLHRYPIEKLDERLSLELFSLKAFEQNHPPKKYIKLAESAVYRADGSPSKLTYLASQVCLIEEGDVRTSVNIEDYERLWDTLESEREKANTIGAYHDKSERNDKSKLMFPTSKSLTTKIASGSIPVKYLAEIVEKIEKGYLEDTDYLIPK